MTSRLPRRTAGTVVLLLALGTSCSGAPVDPPSGLSDRRAAEALRSLPALMGPTSRPTRNPSGGGSYAAMLERNARLLRLSVLTWRYAGPAPAALSAPSSRATAPGSSTGAEGQRLLADVTWRLSGVDRRATTSRVMVTVAADGSSAPEVVSVSGAGQRWPIWLAEPVTVRRTPPEAGSPGSPGGPGSPGSPGSLVVVAGADESARRTAARYAALAIRALSVVRRVVPTPRPLVVEVPSSTQALESSLAGRPGEYAGVAAVSTTADGALDDRAPVRILLNRELLDPLAPRARLVVLAHEATHAETGAATASLPLWLLEGFADHVALRGVALPVRRLAAHAVASVRAQGLPGALPDDAAFAGERAEAAYEQAWLACQVLVRQGGEGRLVRLYRLVARGGTVAEALRQVFGSSQSSLTRTWRERLRHLAE